MSRKAEDALNSFEIIDIADLLMFPNEKKTICYLFAELDI